MKTPIVLLAGLAVALSACTVIVTPAEVDVAMSGVTIRSGEVDTATFCSSGPTTINFNFDINAGVVHGVKVYVADDVPANGATFSKYTTYKTVSITGTNDSLLQKGVVGSYGNYVQLTQNTDGTFGVQSIIVSPTATSKRVWVQAIGKSSTNVTSVQGGALLTSVACP